MEEKNKNILKKGLLSPESDFTSKLMHQLDAEEQALSNVLTKHGEMSTSADFTVQLMKELEGKKPKTPYTPVISLKGWITAAAVFSGVILMALFSGTTGSGKFIPSDRVDAIATSIGGLFKGHSLFVYLLLGALLLSLALVLEQRSAKKNTEQA